MRNEYMDLQKHGGDTKMDHADVIVIIHEVLTMVHGGIVTMRSYGS